MSGGPFGHYEDSLLPPTGGGGRAPLSIRLANPSFRGGGGSAGSGSAGAAGEMQQQQQQQYNGGGVRTALQTRMQGELAEVLSDVQRLTVDRLKAAIKRFNSELNMHARLKITGTKAELIGRVRESLVTIIGANNELDWVKARLILRESRDRVNVSSPTSSVASSSNTPYRPPPQQIAPPPQYHYQHPQYNTNYNLPPPRFDNQTVGGGSTSASQSIRFKPSPFYRVERNLSNVIQLPRAVQGDRKNVFLTFTLSPEQRALLLKSRESRDNDQYAVCVYCTTEEFYSTFRPASAQPEAPIEFPQTCELRINNQLHNANTKGIRKQPGSAPPAVVSNASSFNLNGLNKLEIIYINTERRGFMLANFVKVTSVNDLLQRIKKGKFRSKAEVVNSIVKQNDDPDLEASSQELSLLDPLTMSRIKTPVRGAQCTHVQCYDAQVYLQMNEQTPTWKCPVCSKIVRFDDLTLDGFFQDILNACSADVDKIEVEPNGTWRSEDPVASTSTNGTATTNGNSHPNGNELVGAAASSNEEKKPSVAAPRYESLTLVSDDEEEDDDDDERDSRLVSKALTTASRSPMPSGSGSNTARASGTSTPRRVIETLVLSSDDDNDDHHNNSETDDDDHGPLYKRPRTGY